MLERHSTPRSRLRYAREKLNLSPEEVASKAEIGVPAYYDLETIDGEIEESGCPLSTLKNICDVLGIHVYDLFAEETAVQAKRISREELVEKIRQKLEAHSRTISEFENVIGFRISNCLENPDVVFSWDIECLQFVCKELGIDWKSVLP